MTFGEFWPEPVSMQNQIHCVSGDIWERLERKGGYMVALARQQINDLHRQATTARQSGAYAEAAQLNAKAEEVFSTVEYLAGPELHC